MLTEIIKSFSCGVSISIYIRMIDSFMIVKRQSRQTLSCQSGREVLGRGNPLVDIGIREEWVDAEIPDTLGQI